MVGIESYQWLQWLPCQALGVIGSALALVGPVSVYCDWVRWKVRSATSISVWQHVKLPEQIRPWDTLACCWDIKQPTNNNICVPQLDLWGSPFWVRFLCMWPFFQCVSVSFESVRWNACMHRLDLCLYSHPKELWGNGVRTHVNSKGKSLLPEAQARFEPVMLLHAGQRAQLTTDWAIPAP